MSGQPTPTQLRPALDLTTEYWQAHRLVLSRQRKNHAGEIVATPLCGVYATAFDTAEDATRALRLIQSAPELLRNLMTLTTLIGNAGHGWPQPNLTAEANAAIADADVLIAHLNGA